MKKFVMYGAGNIGRGFIGQVFSDAGYQVGFVDINKEVIGKLNSDNEYPATSSHVSFRRQCDRDIRALDYMRSLIGMEGNYTVLWNNCRDFSEALFEYLISEEF